MSSTLGHWGCPLNACTLRGGMCVVKQGMGNLTILSYINTNLMTGRGVEREGGAGTLAREGLKEVRELQRDVSESVRGSGGGGGGTVSAKALGLEWPRAQVLVGEVRPCAWCRGGRERVSRLSSLLPPI